MADDDAPPGRPTGPTRADAVRFGVFLLVLGGGGVAMLVAGLQRTGSGRAILVGGSVVVLACLVLFGVAVLRVRHQDRELSPDERAAARAARHQQARDRRPAWLDSPAFGVVMLAAAAYWGWFAVAAARRGVLWLAVLDALLCLGTLSAGVRILRRRSVR